LSLNALIDKDIMNTTTKADNSTALKILRGVAILHVGINYLFLNFVKYTSDHRPSHSFQVITIVFNRIHNIGNIFFLQCYNFEVFNVVESYQN
jgi:hypothetical protein